ncbi:hypothetical protein AB0945_11900 [Streptomyces sp. NPDC005474]|uniref:hypothetical protein n=1 Tax=Streptomyces sp. NPDC005474 TaxID=3154878 RepID=UPI003456FCF9
MGHYGEFEVPPILAPNGADEAYDSIRAADDIDSVAANAAEHGFTRPDVEQIKNHLFHDEHTLDYFGDAYRGRFDSNPRIAEAWTRLREGNPHGSDISLLRHELFESNHMKATGNDSYREAHQARARRRPHPGRGSGRARWPRISPNGRLAVFIDFP